MQMDQTLFHSVSSDLAMQQILAASVTHEKKLPYCNQAKSWFDTKTSKKWLADFLLHVKASDK